MPLEDPHNGQVTPLKENANVDQAPVNPQPMTEAKMRDILSQMDQAMTTQAQDATVDEDPQEFPDEFYKVVYAMGVSSSEKAELASYQLKDVSQTWYVQWRDNRSLRGGPVTYEIFKVDFLDQLFPREMREEKLMEFINLCQGWKSVHELSLEFIKLSKYAPSLVSDPRD
ncbi:uncharacterized protein [Solanum lycopersicum]|uniref:uncharacterized protein n=1 Tax=Solanum lycopersicum TaxID=4081 RepID=UPI00374A0276